ncbi:hypothetical protein TNCV_1555351 [Trichonephila clavipes]|nr:hypothetical protein TNCV_1555351 [Trichonephila clavipes]
MNRSTPALLCLSSKCTLGGAFSTRTHSLSRIRLCSAANSASPSRIITTLFHYYSHYSIRSIPTQGRGTGGASRVTGRGMSLSRSHCGGCSATYNTPSRTKVVCRRLSTHTHRLQGDLKHLHNLQILIL